MRRLPAQPCRHWRETRRLGRSGGRVEGSRAPSSFITIASFTTTSCAAVVRSCCPRPAAMKRPTRAAASSTATSPRRCFAHSPRAPRIVITTERFPPKSFAPASSIWCRSGAPAGSIQWSIATTSRRTLVSLCLMRVAVDRRHTSWHGGCILWPMTSLSRFVDIFISRHVRLPLDWWSQGYWTAHDESPRQGSCSGSSGSPPSPSPLATGRARAVPMSSTCSRCKDVSTATTTRPSAGTTLTLIDLNPKVGAWFVLDMALL